MGTALKRHKLSIDVIVTLHVHHKIQQINTSYKILQKAVTMYMFSCNQFSFLFLFIIPLILPPLSLFQISHQIFFLTFNHTIVSKLSQLSQRLHTEIFHVLFKNHFHRCHCIKLDKKVTIGKEIEKRNKQNLLISQGLLLPEKMIILLKLQNTDKLIFSLTSTGTSQRHDVKENFVFSNMCTITTISVEFRKY